MRAVPWRLIGFAVIALLVIGGWNSFASHIPLTSQWWAARRAAQIDTLRGDVSKLAREATGNAEIGQATETYHTREVIVREITSQAETEARNAPDADTPLTGERASRLRAADDRLCQSAPTLCATPDAP